MMQKMFETNGAGTRGIGDAPNFSSGRGQAFPEGQINECFKACSSHKIFTHKV